MNSAWLPTFTALCDVWTEALGRATLQGGLAVLGVWLICRAVPSLPGVVRSWLWRLVYLRLLLALCWPHALELPLLPAPVSPPVPAPIAAAPITAMVVHHHPLLPAQVETLPVDLPPASALSAPAPGRATPPWSLWLGGIWLLGVAWCAARLRRQGQQFARLRSRAVRLEEGPLQERWQTLCGRARVRRVPELCCLEGLDGPTLLGGLPPMVALPKELVREWPPEQLELALAHELAHVKRADLLWSWLPALAHVGFYFHPLVWLAAREWRLAQEMACDTLALRLAHGSVGEYASMLLRLAHRRTQVVTPSLAGSLRVASESPDCLRRRLLAMKRVESFSYRRAALLSGAVVVVAGVLLVPFRVVAQSPTGGTGSKAVTVPARVATLEQATEKPSSKPSALVSLTLSNTPLSQVVQKIRERSSAQIVIDDPDGTLAIQRVKFISLRNQAIPKTIAVLSKAMGLSYRRDKDGIYHLFARPAENDASSGEATSAPLADGAVEEPKSPKTVTVNIRDLVERVRRTSQDADLDVRAHEQADLSVRLRALDQELATRRSGYGPEDPRILALLAERDAVAGKLTRRGGEGAPHLAPKVRTSGVRSVQKEQERQQTRVAILHSKLSELTERLARLQQDFTPQSPEVQELQRSRDFLAMQLQQEEAKLLASAAAADVAAAQQAFQLTEADRRRRAAEVKANKLRKEQRLKQNQAADAAKQVAEINARIAQAEAHRSVLRAEQARLAAERAATKARLRAAEAEVARLRQDFTPASPEVQKVQAERDLAQQQLQEQMAQLEATRAALQEGPQGRTIFRRRTPRGDLSGRTRLNQDLEAARKREREGLSRQFTADRMLHGTREGLGRTLRQNLDALPAAQRDALARKLRETLTQVDLTLAEVRRSVGKDGQPLDREQHQRLLDRLQQLQAQISAEVARRQEKERPGAPAEKAVR